MKSLLEFLHYVMDFIELQHMTNEAIEKRLTKLLEVIKIQNDQIIALTQKVDTLEGRTTKTK